MAIVEFGIALSKLGTYKLKVFNAQVVKSTLVSLWHVVLSTDWNGPCSSRGKPGHVRSSELMCEKVEQASCVFFYSQEKKKMVRYINSQMVTTKGEKFIETKKPESEEMKKTYTHLKPARRYHFH